MNQSPSGTLPARVDARRIHMMAWALVGLTAIFLMLGMCVGSTGFDSLALLWADWRQPTALDAASHHVAQQIVWQIRLPRTLGAWAGGALLGLAGALAQGLFRNPLADPYLLGSASGASLGVALALALTGAGADMLVDGSLVWHGAAALSLFSSSMWAHVGLTGAAFLGAALAVLLTLMLARGVQQTMRLLLAGVVVGVVLGAMTHLVLLSSPDSLQAMQTFMLGSTSFVGSTACLLMLGVWLVCVLVSASLGRVLDGLSLGDATAQSLGLAVRPLRLVLLAVLTLATASAVAQTGLIAFVGLAAPHLVRAVVRSTHGTWVWLCSGMGGVLLMAADLGARWVLAPQELPVGVLTAVLGGVYLLYLMQRAGSGTVRT